MSGRCTICRHPQHEAITVSAIRNGLRPTARTFQVSLPALYRHKGHLPRTLVKAGQAQEVTSANSLLAEVTDLSGQQEQTQQLPMPALDFQFEGQSKTMRTFVLEPGAVKPAEVIAAEQAAAAAKQPTAAPHPAVAAPPPPARR